MQNIADLLTPEIVRAYIKCGSQVEMVMNALRSEAKTVEDARRLLAIIFASGYRYALDHEPTISREEFAEIISKESGIFQIRSAEESLEELLQDIDFE